jgi:hypothetical protein
VGKGAGLRRRVKREIDFKISYPNIMACVLFHHSMDDGDKLRLLYDDSLTKGPFPAVECGQAQISGNLHGDLILYLADIAGLASWGDQGLSSLSEREREKFRDIASRSILVRLPELRERITPQATPKLHALLEATERARLLILETLNS